MAHTQRRDDRPRGPPQVQNSRFTAAVAADEDYVDKDERERRHQERMFEREQGFQDRERDGYGGRDDYRDGGRGYRDGGRGRYRDENFQRGGYGGGRFSDGGNFRDPRGSLPDRPREAYEDDGRRTMDSLPSTRGNVDKFLKPKAPPALDNVLQMPPKPSADQEANMLKAPSKKEEESPEETTPEEVHNEPAPEEVPPVPEVDIEEMLSEFASGKLQGAALREWCKERNSVLPSVDKLLLRMLTEQEKLNPDVNCGWAAPERYGEALLFVVGDDLQKQMEVLWGVQFYCDSIGFPKLDGESVVQAMFRSMYKFDLAAEEAFEEWKEDESDEHEKGKMNAIIQTVDWFIWLEEDEEEDEEGEEYEEE